MVQVDHGLVANRTGGAAEAVPSRGFDDRSYSALRRFGVRDCVGPLRAAAVDEGEVRAVLGEQIVQQARDGSRVAPSPAPADQRAHGSVSEVPDVDEALFAQAGVAPGGHLFLAARADERLHAVAVVDTGQLLGELADVDCPCGAP